jgi:hypothetical protein
MSVMSDVQLWLWALCLCGSASHGPHSMAYTVTATKADRKPGNLICDLYVLSCSWGQCGT